jgi:hypothetical protein
VFKATPDGVFNPFEFKVVKMGEDYYLECLFEHMESIGVKFNRDEIYTASRSVLEKICTGDAEMEFFFEDDEDGVCCLRVETRDGS